MREGNHQLSKTELLVFQVSHTIQHQISVKLGSSLLLLTKHARHIQVYWSHFICSQSSRFALYSIRKIRPYLSEYAARLLVQALVSRLDYYNALLAGLTACTLKPQQMIQNLSARWVFNEPQKKAHDSHLSPLVSSRLRCHAYKAMARTAPTFLKSLIQVYIPSPIYALLMNETPHVDHCVWARLCATPWCWNRLLAKSYSLSRPNSEQLHLRSLKRG